MKAALVGALGLVLLAAGCGGPKTVTTMEATSPPEQSLPERHPYTMAVGDVLNVRFFYYPNYNLTAVVRPDGMITIPLVGEVMAEGMMPSRLEEIIRAHYSEVIAEPEVSVLVAEFAEQRVFVLGEVSDPGIYDLKGRMTVVDAIAAAGGYTDRGRLDSVILMRRSQEGTFSGTRIDLEEILASERGENTYLMPGDVVHVPMSFIAKVDVFVEQYFKETVFFWQFWIAGQEIVNPGDRYILGRSALFSGV